MSTIQFFYPATFDSVISDDPDAEDKVNAFPDLCKSILKQKALDAMSLLDVGFIVYKGRKITITEAKLSKIKLPDDNIKSINPSEKWVMRTVVMPNNVVRNLTIYSKMICMLEGKKFSLAKVVQDLMITELTSKVGAIREKALE